MSLKAKISSPLEAGPSLLHTHLLPPHLLPPLEHLSARLARKSLHLTLVVAHRDYQLPPVLSPSLCTSPSPSPSPPSPPSSRGFFTKHLPRWARRSSSPSPSSSSSSSASSLPNSPRSILSSSSSPTYSSSAAPSPYFSPYPHRFPVVPPPQHTLYLVHPATLPPATESALRSALDHTITTTPRRHRHRRRNRPDTTTTTTTTTPHITLVSAAAYGFSPALINNSIAQNDVLFASDGLSLVALDRLYSLKAALACYSKTRAPLRLEDAVDELRRYVLAAEGGGGSKKRRTSSSTTSSRVCRARLLRSYDWLGVSGAALKDLDYMYRCVYGGAERVGAIDGVGVGVGATSGFAGGCKDRQAEAFSPSSDDEGEDEVEDGAGFHGHDGAVFVEQCRRHSLALETDVTGTVVCLTTSEPVQKQLTPAKQTVLYPSFSEPSASSPPPPLHDDEEEEEEDSKGRLLPTPPQSTPINHHHHQQQQQQQQHQNQREKDGPSPSPPPPTPSDYDDFSPLIITSPIVEWGTLLIGRAFRGARTVEVR